MKRFQHNNKQVNRTERAQKSEEVKAEEEESIQGFLGSQRSHKHQNLSIEPAHNAASPRKQESIKAPAKTIIHHQEFHNSVFINQKAPITTDEQIQQKLCHDYKAGKINEDQFNHLMNKTKMPL